MAASTCVKCGPTTFEMVEANNILNSRTKKFFVQCAKCGGVVGVLDYFNTADLLTEQSRALKEIAARVGAHVNLPA